MQKLISYPLSIIAILLFFFFLCLFQPIQFVCFRLFGYQAHKKSVDVLNFFLLHVQHVMFSTASVEFEAELPEGRPYIFVANHQGLYDILGMGWFLRRYHPKYVSKVELGKGIPSVSFNLRYGGSALIDRKDPKQALPVLKQMGEYINRNNRSVIIYPEGTRSRSPRKFAPNGLKILCKYAPNAYVVPVSISDSWKVFRYGTFPLGVGNRLRFVVHAPMAVADYDFDTLFQLTEKTVIDGIVNT